ncbi:DUF2459 domain-containing protein, partial [bacterium]
MGRYPAGAAQAQHHCRECHDSSARRDYGRTSGACACWITLRYRHKYARPQMELRRTRIFDGWFGQPKDDPMAARVERSVRSLLLTLLVIATIVSGCAAPVMHGDPSSMDTAHPHSIYVVRQPWHTGIVVLAADVPANAWLARRDFPDAAYLEVGWGDRAYYQAADP